MKKAINLLKGFSLEELVKQFELTTNNNKEGIADVRGWLMDAIEEKNPIGFDKWLEIDYCEDSDLRKCVL